MASEVSICNRALTKVGANRITSLSDGSVNAGHCNAIYTEVRDRELRKHVWTFATTRVQLAADTDAPDFGPANQFTLPTDFIRLAPRDPEDNLNSLDWAIEGRKLLTNEDAPLNVRYVYRVEDPNEMDPLFREVLAAALALELVEPLTQSNTKPAKLTDEYRTAVAEAKKANAIEQVAAQPPEDEWLSVRVGGRNNTIRMG